MSNVNFGSEQNPIRPSSIAKIVNCPLAGVIMFGTGPDDDLGGKAAQTGNLTHKAIAAFHLEEMESRKLYAGLQALAASELLFPDGSLSDARRWFEYYANDPRNQTAKVVAVEKEVRLMLPCHPNDPTGAPIYFRGTLDQIRELPDGRLVVDDVKTGSPSGWDMLHDYACQQAAYVLAARASGFPTAQPGRIIRTIGYTTRGANLPSPDGVFWEHPWTVDDAPAILYRLRQVVAQIRAGDVTFSAGAGCRFCPVGGLQNCIPIARERKFSGFALDMVPNPV